MLSAISCMVKIQSLEDLHTEIDYLNNRVKEIGNSWGFFNSFEKSHLTEKLRKLEKKLFYQVDDYLTISSDEYKKVINEIHELLENEHIQFTVYTKDFSLIGSHATKLEGVIQPNGYSYSEAVGQNINWLPFDSFAFPSVLSGKINHWGQLTLRKTKTDYAFLRRVPKKLSGAISKSGAISWIEMEALGAIAICPPSNCCSLLCPANKRISQPSESVRASRISVLSCSMV